VGLRSITLSYSSGSRLVDDGKEDLAGKRAEKKTLRVSARKSLAGSGRIRDGREI